MIDDVRAILDELALRRFQHGYDEHAHGWQDALLEVRMPRSELAKLNAFLEQLGAGLPGVQGMGGAPEDASVVL